MNWMIRVIGLEQSGMKCVASRMNQTMKAKREGGHLSTPIPTRPRIGKHDPCSAGSGLERDSECLPDVSRHDEAGR